VVFVEESAESVASLDRCLRWWWRWRLGRERRVSPERAVWALGVVVVDVDVQDAVEVARAEDQQPVQAFGSCPGPWQGECAATVSPTS
jgi:hypothetical protein